ncbi:MAG TPA: pitrilysin family protein [Gammaproteobacteria bacterium]|nr:pitrilysin family protein [Gammaproteobacteria bacterium]
MLRRLILVVALYAPWPALYAEDNPPAVAPNPEAALSTALKTNPLVHEYTLDNGLKLVVKEDHRAPVVVSQVWYKVGSSYEPTGITGISHVLEHMMFQGTEKYAPNEFSHIIAANGGKENAFTARDYTAYYQQLEKSRLPVSFELEADRMRGLTLGEEQVSKEVKVVMEERRLRTDDDPQSLTYEQFNGVAFISSPYHHPVIGWMDDLVNLRVEDLKEWYKTWYAPNNATVVVVGDVDPDAVLTLAKKYFGPLKPSKITPPKPRRELEQKGIRRMVVKAPAELPYLLMGYHVPVLKATDKDGAWEPYALEVLAGILSGGDSARFAKHLVRESQIAASASAGYGLYARLPDLFMLDGTPGQGHNIDELEQAIRAQIKRLQDEPVSAVELARIKAQVVANQVYERDSTFAQAMQIGSLETVGLDWRLMDAYVERVSAVTPEQIQQVARKYLIDDRLTLATLDPLPIDPDKKRAAAQGGALGGGHVR